MYAELKTLAPVIHSPPETIEIAVPNVSFKAGSSAMRMMDRRRTLSVTVSPLSIVVESSSYTKFEDFSATVGRVLNAVQAASPLAGINRVGLRYIDEIRVEGVSQVADWQLYVHSALLAGLHVTSDFVPSMTQCLAEFDIGGGHKTVMRFGVQRGFVVDPNGPLRLKRIDEGPFFLIDLDSFWAAPNGETPEFSTDFVLEKCRKLREPIRALFEASITDRLRDDVLRKGTM